jgi:hypothetical protein
MSRSARRHAPVMLQLRVTQPGMSATVTTADHRLAPTEQLVLRCEDLCRQELPRGHYTLTLHYGDEEQGSDSQRIQLDRPIEYTSDPPDATLRVLGLSSAITGALLLISGVSALVPGVLDVLFYHGSGYDYPHGWTYYGLIATPIGVGLGLVGWSFYKRNRWPFEHTKLAREPTLSWQVLPSPSGVAGQLVGSF